MRKDRPDEIIHKMVAHLSAALTCAALCEEKEGKERIRKIITCQMTMAQHTEYLKELLWDQYSSHSIAGENENPFMVKVDEAESTVRFPQVINATVEIFQDSGWKQEMEIEIEIVRPKSADEKPLIALSCPKFARYMEQAKKQQHEELIRQLEGWLVVAGSPE